MTVHLVTFSDESMSRSRELCVLSGRHHGVGVVHEYEPSGVASAFVEHKAIWSNPKGCGLWAWKPVIVDAFMSKIAEGDILIYADAGVEFIGDVGHIMNYMDQDIFLFGNNWEHAHWCKRDVIEALWPAEEEQPVSDVNRLPDYEDWLAWSRFGKQVQASVIFFRVSDYSRAFVKEWLDWCLFEGGRLIDDSPSRALNHPEFREHRHDQAVLTTMAYREGIKLHYWPASYNDGAFVYEKLPEYAGDDYPILFNHHRRRNHEWEQVA